MSGDPRHALRRRYLPNMAPYAWLLLPLAALVGVLILLFSDEQAPGPKPLEIADQSAAGATVFMAGPSAASGSWNPVPLSEQSRQKVLENLRDFRAVYKLAGPQLTVVAAGDDSRATLARQLGSALSQYGLGRVSNVDLAAEPVPRGVAGEPAAIVLHCAQRDSAIAREMLASLEPYLAGAVSLVWDNSLRIDQMRLEIRGVPRFAANGEALMQAGRYAAPP